jgi:CASPASE and TPR Repeat-Associated N-terminal domain/CASPASE and TPR Repeat-Associated C-terminal domain
LALAVGYHDPRRYALWETGHPADTRAMREIVLVASADQDDGLSAWAWSDGTPTMPPFARYLMQVAKLRYEARVLDGWQRTDWLDTSRFASLGTCHRGPETGKAQHDGGA